MPSMENLGWVKNEAWLAGMKPGGSLVYVQQRCKKSCVWAFKNVILYICIYNYNEWRFPTVPWTDLFIKHEPMNSVRCLYRKLGQYSDMLLVWFRRVNRLPCRTPVVVLRCCSLILKHRQKIFLSNKWVAHGSEVCFIGRRSRDFKQGHIRLKLYCNAIILLQ